MSGLLSGRIDRNAWNEWLLETDAISLHFFCAHGRNGGIAAKYGETRISHSSRIERYPNIGGVITISK
jgi:hypothetical protein